MNKEYILITGGCGFIGASLILKLLQSDSPPLIKVLDNFSTGTPEDLSRFADVAIVKADEPPDENRISIIEGDIRDTKTTLLCTSDAKCIIHLAANTGVGPSVENPRLDMECNVVGTLNMLEAARLNGVNRFIFASSGAPAGEVEPPIHEELPPHPVSPYGASKLAGEGYCSAYFRTFGIDTVCLRFGNVYGPMSKRKSSVVAKFIRQAMNGDTCEIYGDGTQTRDFLYIDDLVEAIQLCMDRNVGGETFQIATGMENTVSTVADIIADSLASYGIKMRITHESPRLGDVKRNFSDTSKAKRILGWKADTALEAGIEKTISYFINTRNQELG